MDTRNLNTGPINELPSEVLSALGGAEHVEGLRAAAVDAVWSRFIKNDPFGSDAGAPLVGALRNRDAIQPRSAPTWRYVYFAAAMLTVGIATIWGGSRTAPTTTPITKTYSTIPGQRASITLKDGSSLTLAPATRLSIHDRVVNLDGEAYFNVRSGKSEPFIVNAAGTVTRVLGTSFIVRKYPSDQSVTVAVGDGKVAFQSSVLSAGQGASATVSTGTVLMRDSEVASTLGRTSGRLTFDRAEVRNVIAELERWYGVEFRGLTPELLGYHITATFTGDRLSSQTIQTLSIALDSRTRQSGRVITFQHEATEQDK